MTHFTFRLGSVRFGLGRFGSVWLISVRFVSVRFISSNKDVMPTFLFAIQILNFRCDSCNELNTLTNYRKYFSSYNLEK